MTFTILIEQKQSDKINGFDEKSRRIIRENLDGLSKDPYPGKRGDKEKFSLRDGYILYRLHIGRSGTAFYRVYDTEKVVKVLEVITIEQAHKKYGRFKSLS